jgi:hypothetical protein
LTRGKVFCYTQRVILILSRKVPQMISSLRVDAQRPSDPKVGGPIEFHVKRAIGTTWQVVRHFPAGVGGYRTTTEVVSTHEGHRAAARACARRNGVAV